MSSNEREGLRVLAQVKRGDLNLREAAARRSFERLTRIPMYKSAGTIGPACDGIVTGIQIKARAGDIAA